jgi:hypothetical protein
VIFTTADGRLQGGLGGTTPDTTLRIDLFASPDYGPGGAGEAEDYLGSLAVTTDGHGQATFDIPYTPPAGLPIITATATDPQGNTSEVSALRQATFLTPAQSIRLTSGQPVTFSAASGDASALHDPDAGPFDLTWDVTLSVGAGKLTLAGTAGLIGTGDGTRSLSYRGPLSAINAALAGMTYRPHAGFHGNATLRLSAQSDGAAPVQGTVVITDGLFLVTTTADRGPGSLRQAILHADAVTGGGVTIDFAIPGPGVRMIDLASPLPPLTTSALIDGTTQPGYTGTPLIAIVAPSSGPADALTIAGTDLTLRGVSIGVFGLGLGTPPDSLTIPSIPVRPGPGGQVDTYKIDTTADGLLRALVHTRGPTTRLLLLDSEGRILVQSDGLSPVNPDDVIDEHLAAGMYLLEVESGGAAGDYGLTVTLTPAIPPFQPVTLNGVSGGVPIAVGDFNGDGIPDLATPYGVNLGVGDGTFRAPVADLGLTDFDFRHSIVAGDFNGDGKLDLALTDSNTNAVDVLLGNGDGTFQPATSYAVGSSPSALVAGDFNGDGKIDLAVLDSGPSTISILLGNGDGTFRPAVDYAVGNYGGLLLDGDFNADGHLDLAVAYTLSYDSQSVSISILLGNGDGTFRPANTVSVGGSPSSISMTAADFNADGHLDLAILSSSALTVRASAHFYNDLANSAALRPLA